MADEEDEEDPDEAEQAAYGRVLTDAERAWVVETGNHPDTMPTLSEQEQYEAWAKDVGEPDYDSCVRWTVAWVFLVLAVVLLIVFVGKP